MTSPAGTLIRNTQRQLAASMSDGRHGWADGSGEGARRSPDGDRDRHPLGGKARSTSANDDGMSAAAPAACTTRNTTSTATVGAAAQATEPSVNTTAPIRNSRLWPMRSATFPAGMSSAATAIV